MDRVSRPAFHPFMAALVLLLFSGTGLASVTDVPAPSRPPTTPSAPLSPRELALASPVPIWRRDGILVEQGGRALYVFDKDRPGASRCDALCMSLWPPHYAAPDARAFGPFTLARTPDGRRVWAFQGRPLYRWASDRRRGAAGGDGVAGVWFLVRVPKALEAQITPYFPMPAPRPVPAPATTGRASPDTTPGQEPTP